VRGRGEEEEAEPSALSNVGDGLGDHLKRRSTHAGVERRPLRLNGRYCTGVPVGKTTIPDRGPGGPQHANENSSREKKKKTKEKKKKKSIC